MILSNVGEKNYDLLKLRAKIEKGIRRHGLNLAHGAPLKTVLEEAYGVGNVFYYSPLTYFRQAMKEIEKVEATAFWILLVRPDEKWWVNYPPQIYWGALTPSKAGGIIRFAGGIYWQKRWRTLDRDWYDGMNVQWFNPVIFNKLWMNSQMPNFDLREKMKTQKYMTTVNFEIDRKDIFGNNITLLVLGLPTHPFEENLGLLNWWW